MSIEVRAADKCAFVGVSGYGKTHLLISILNRFKAGGTRVLVYDAEHERQYDYLDDKTRYRPKIPVTYDTAKKFKQQIIREFDTVCGQVFAQGNMIFVMESLDMFADKYHEMPPAFYKLIHWGKKKRIGLMMTSRRIADCNKTALSQCKHWFVFYTYLPNDIKYLRDMIGDTAEQAKSLEERYYIYWANNKAQICKPIGESA